MNFSVESFSEAENASHGSIKRSCALPWAMTGLCEPMKSSKSATVIISVCCSIVWVMGQVHFECVCSLFHILEQTWDKSVSNVRWLLTDTKESRIANHDFPYWEVTGVLAQREWTYIKSFLHELHIMQGWNQTMVSSSSKLVVPQWFPTWCHYDSTCYALWGASFGDCERAKYQCEG